MRGLFGLQVLSCSLREEMGLSTWAAFALVPLALSAPVAPAKRYKQSPLSAKGDGQTVQVNGTSYYVPAKPEVL